MTYAYYRNESAMELVLLIFKYFTKLSKQYTRKYASFEWNSEYAIPYDTMENCIRINNMDQIDDIKSGIQNIWNHMGNYNGSNDAIVGCIEPIRETYTYNRR